MTAPETPPVVDTLYLRIPRDLKHKIRAYADRSGCSMTDAVIGLVTRALRSEDGDQ